MESQVPENRPPRYRPLVWIAGFASVAAIVILVLAALQAARDAARRTETQVNLKQIAFAMHNYGQTYGGEVLPAGGTFREDGTPLHGWTTWLVPFLEASPFFDRIDQSIPWDDPTQIDHFMHYKMGIFLDPSIAQQETPDGLPVVHFTANQWLLNRGEQRHLWEIIDFQHTMLIGDAFGDFRPMGEPFHWRDPTAAFRTSPRQFGHVSRRITHVAYLDGQVDVVGPDIDAKVFTRLAGPEELRPVPELVLRPTEPYRLKSKEYWRFLYTGDDGRLSKGGYGVRFKLSSDNRKLVADFGKSRVSDAEPISWQGELAAFVKSQPIEHVRIVGELRAHELEPFLQISTLQRLTISDATIEGDKAAALRRASPRVTVD